MASWAVKGSVETMVSSVGCFTCGYGSGDCGSCGWSGDSGWWCGCCAWISRDNCWCSWVCSGELSWFYGEIKVSWNGRPGGYVHCIGVDLVLEDIQWCAVGASVGDEIRGMSHSWVLNRARMLSMVDWVCMMSISELGREARCWSYSDGGDVCPVLKSGH